MIDRNGPIIPDPRGGQRDFVREFRPWWQQAEEEWWGEFTPQNVRHTPDPEWRKRVISIQAAHDRKGIWRPISWLFYFSMYAFSVGGVAITVLQIGVPAIVLATVVLVFMRLMKKAAEEV